MFCKTIERDKGRKLYLYSSQKREYNEVEGLPSINQNNQHLRWNSLRNEWVFYSPVRQKRTFLPNVSNCPLCPSQKDGMTTDIPVSDYEIAVFDNRFSALSFNPPNIKFETNTEISSAYGSCEVISYSQDHNTKFQSLTIEHVSLLIKVWSDRFTKLMQNPNINYVIPFENKGKEIGVTLEHPHGQIYSMKIIPEIIKTQAKNQKIQNTVSNLINSLDNKLEIEKDENAISFVPPFARYPYEVWIAPFKRVDCANQLADKEIISIAKLLISSVKRLDHLFGKPMPYTMAVHFPPRGYENNFHHYISFQPMRRDTNKLKFLAGIEQITGLMLSDILPEDAAFRLKSLEID